MNNRLSSVAWGIVAVLAPIIGVLMLLGAAAVAGWAIMALFNVIVVALLIAATVTVLGRKIRLAVVYPSVGLVALVLALVFLVQGRTTEVAVGLAVSVLLSVFLCARNRRLYAQFAADSNQHQEYTDHFGTQHRFILTGYHLLPWPLNEPWVMVTLAALGVVAALLMLCALTWEQAWAATATSCWAVVAAFVAVCGLAVGATAYFAERKFGVEIFGQCLPHTAGQEAREWLDRRCPQPFRAIANAVREVWTAFVELYTVTVRR